MFAEKGESENTDSAKIHTIKLVGILNNSEKKNEEYFVKNIQEFKKKLRLYPDVKRNELGV